MPYDRRLSQGTTRILFTLILSLGLSACATSRQSGSIQVPREMFEPDRAAAAAPASRVPGMAAPDHLRHTVHVSATTNVFAVPTVGDELGESSPFDHAHPAVDHFIDYYSDQSPEIVARSLTRAMPHLPKIREMLSQAGVPADIAYLPIVESHFKASARSHAGATGIWQFMRATGQRYGLRIDGCVDERRDPIRSTLAAARYLAELHERFEDWHLALAAYNVGEGRIYRIMRDHGVNDYWTMVDRQLLPRETAQYVPRFLAAAAVAKTVDTWGFSATDVPTPEVDTGIVRVRDPLSLRTVATLAGVDRETVQALNPALACNRVPSGGYAVHLPVDAIGAFETAYANLDARTIEVERGVHRVRRGESPGSIARRYGVSVGQLMRANGIRNPRLLRVNSRLRIPGRT
jgi:membrane-bound lytic murein transglycosylase D